MFHVISSGVGEILAQIRELLPMQLRFFISSTPDSEQHTGNLFIRDHHVLLLNLSKKPLHSRTQSPCFESGFLYFESRVFKSQVRFF